MTLQLSALSKHFANHTVFEDVTLKVGDGSRIGLIGRNGCGKSTLLKIITGDVSPDEGTISRSPGLNVNYLSQEPRITPTLILGEEMRSVFVTLNALAEKETELIENLSDSDRSENEQMALARQLDGVHSEMERLDFRSVDARIGRILNGLGFSQEDMARKTGDFSGGWQMRINLAKVLLEGADILLLDEPTNHLDLAAREWLEGFLAEFPGGLVVVSHDRRFLDKVTTETAELEQGRLRLWPGNYTRHLELKAAELDAQGAAYARQQKEIEKQTAFVEKFRASATRSTQAKSREKQLAKMERIEAPREDKRRMVVRFPSPEASGKQVFTLRSVAKAYGEKQLFSGLDANLQRHQRVFLLGANGVGKTTLFRLIMGLESADVGEIRPGHNVRTGYFSQNQLDTLDPALSVFDTMREACPRLTNTELRGLLGRFLFSGDEVFKPVSVLSGGEKSKLALARLMTSGPNTLLLDEPTNHMDIPAREVIADALSDYEGTILCVSHDRYFVQQLATEIWEIYNGQLLVYGGDYDYYAEKREERHAQIDGARGRTAQTPAKAPPDGRARKQADFKERKAAEKEARKLEKRIIKLEEEIASLQAGLQDSAIQSDFEKLQALGEEIRQKQDAHASLEEQWLTLAEMLGG